MLTGFSIIHMCLCAFCCCFCFVFCCVVCGCCCCFFGGWGPLKSPLHLYTWPIVSTYTHTHQIVHTRHWSPGLFLSNQTMKGTAARQYLSLFRILGAGQARLLENSRKIKTPCKVGCNCFHSSSCVCVLKSWAKLQKFWEPVPDQQSLSCELYYNWKYSLSKHIKTRTH